MTLPLIKDNHINLFYFFDEAKDPEAIDAKSLCLPLPDELAPALDQITNVWKRREQTISQDLLPNIRQLFTKGEHQAVETWVLDSNLLKLLNGSRRALHNGKKPLALTLDLAPVAYQRLQPGDSSLHPPRLHIDGIYYHRFRTGLGVVEAEIRLTNGQLPWELLQESLHALSRFNNICWLEEDEEACTLSHAERKQAPTMGKLVRGLLGCRYSNRADRVFSHVCLRVEQPELTPELEKQLVYLARHYTSDYKFSGELGDTQVFRDFDDVCHCIANEGMATLVSADDDAPEFLTDYFNRVSRVAHLPICLLNFHAENAIHHYLSLASVWLEKDRAPALDVEKLQEQQRHLVNFDNHFFMPVVSRINTHNRLHRAMQTIKYLEQQHQIVSRTTRLVNALIAAQQKKKADKENQKRSLRYCRMGSWGMAAAGYLTMHSIASEFQELMLHNWLDEGGRAWGFFHHHAGEISFACAVIAGIATLAYAFSRCRQGHTEPHDENIALELAETLHIYHLLKK